MADQSLDLLCVNTIRTLAIDTIEKVRASLAVGDDLFCLIGADAFAEIRTWYRWQDVARQVVFLVIGRPGASYSIPPEAKAERLDSPHLDISSSTIRQQLGRGELAADVPAGVLDYIVGHGLYGVSQRG